MKIQNRAKIAGNFYDITYNDADDFNKLTKKHIKQAYGVCFYGDKLVVVHNKKGHWNLPGGTVEEGEHYEETLKRELQEEADMKVLAYKPIGYQYTTSLHGNPIYQLRYVAQVEPYGEFEKDPDGAIDRFKLINAADVKKYFDWGKIGDRLIERALELKDSL